jgi:hypothetical protein
MKYQIEVSELKENRKVNPIRLRPRLSIKEVAYWQKRVASLMPDFHVTCVVANGKDFNPLWP